MLLNHNKGINEEDYVTNLRSHAVSKPKSLPKTFLETTNVATITDSNSIDGDNTLSSTLVVVKSYPPQR